MAADAKADKKLQIGYLLILALVEYSSLRRKARIRVMEELTRIVRGTERFRKDEAEGKLLRLPTGDGMALVFFSDLQAPIECAMEISAALKKHPNIRLRMGIESGPIDQVGDVKQQSNSHGIDMARQVMQCGDPGHILLSRRLAYDLVSSFPHWNTHLYELDDFELKRGQPISLVNFYTEEIGNPELPTKLKRAREETLAKAKTIAGLPPWLAKAIITIFLSAVTAGAFLFHRHTRNGEAVWPFVSTPEKSIAVLPFVDLSPGRDQEYFCDGLSEEIRHALAEHKGLRVVARTSSSSFKGKDIEANEMGRKLDVANFLEGSVRREGNVTRITARLIQAHDGSPGWSETFETELQGIFAVEEEITRAVVDALKIKPARGWLARSQQNTLAYDLYLQGLFLSNKRSEEDLRTSLDFFRLALEKDPSLARAWTGIARDWMGLANAYVSPRDAYPQAQLAARKALTFDERDAEAHAYLGEAKRILSYDLERSEVELKRALEINPNSVVAHIFMALVRSALGHSEAGLAEIQQAVRLDPLSPVVANSEVSAYVANDRFDQALAAAKRTMEIDPNYVYFEPEFALVYREQGKLSEALDIYSRLEKTRQQPTAGLAITYARLGKTEEAVKALDELLKIAETRYFPAEEIASVYVALGDKEEALRWLDRAVQEHSGRIHEIGFAREFRALRSDPRFAELLRRIGLDPAKFRSRKNNR